MQIVMDLDEQPPGLRLIEADDFRAFAIVARTGGPGRQLGDAEAAGLGRVAGDHVFVSPRLLKDLAGQRGRDAAWLAALASMISFASAQGWVSDAGDIRAHVQWEAGGNGIAGL